MLKEKKKINECMWLFTGMLILNTILVIILDFIAGKCFNWEIIGYDSLAIGFLWLGYYVAYKHFK